MAVDSRFSKVRGKVSYNKEMKPLTWLNVGGEAELFFQPFDVDDLCEFLSMIPKNMIVTPIGVCSNILVRDGGIPGAVVRLGRGFSSIKINENYITAGAAALDSRVAYAAAEKGLDLSFLRTIPGTIGGAVKMNAGCYGSCVQDIFESCEVVTRAGKITKLNGADLKFGYRNSNLLDDSIITEVTLKAKRLDPSLIRRFMEENQKKRLESQPINQRTGGSTFKNPHEHYRDPQVMMSAWQLIDKAKLRGKKLRGAKVSDLHSNFLINTGNAEAEDFELLGELIQKKVLINSGVNLEWEIKRVGLRK